MRGLEQLVDTQQPAWPLVQSWLDAASNPVSVLPADEADADVALLKLQVTTRSPMGAIVHHTGGFLIDDGWLRILGSGNERLTRSLPKWNQGRAPTKPGLPPPYLLVADDVLGGFFAIDNGGLSRAPGKVHYFAPDSLAWQNLDRSYSDFIVFALSGDLERFYEGFRWPGWRDDVAAISGDQAFSIQPFLWAAGPPLPERSRRAVPIAELWNLQQDIARQMQGVPK